MFSNSDKRELVDPERALEGRSTKMEVAARHHVLDAALEPPFPDGLELALFGMGCFWGAERSFWQAAGVYSTAVGYAGGSTESPTYKEVCSGTTGHAEVVQVEYEPAQVSYETLLERFWDCHDPTTRNRQGPDVGTQYRSGVFVKDEAQKAAAEATKAKQSEAKGAIATEITEATEFYPAEDYHQRYFEKRGISH